MRLYRKCANNLCKVVIIIVLIKLFKGITIKKLTIFIFFSLLIYPVHALASWVIINDDGSTEVYQPDVIKPYSVPVKKKKQVQRSITKKVQKMYQTEEKIMYLTFDDGPLLGSNNIITVLQEEEVQATMFMVGKHIKKSKYRKKIFKRALDEPLILVANHTYTHANGRYRHFYSNTDRVLLDIQRMDDILFNNDQSYQVPYCRLAGRNVFRLPTIHRDDPGIPKRYNEAEKYDALWDAGYQIFGWDYQWSYNPRNGEVYHSPDTLVKNIERIYKRNKTRSTGKFVLLMHDFSFRDKFHGKEDLQSLIQKLKLNGWSFETLTTYI